MRSSYCLKHAKKVPIIEEENVNVCQIDLNQSKNNGEWTSIFCPYFELSMSFTIQFLKKNAICFCR